MNAINLSQVQKVATITVCNFKKAGLNKENATARLNNTLPYSNYPLIVKKAISVFY